MSDASHVGGRAPEPASARPRSRTGSRSRCRCSAYPHRRPLPVPPPRHWASRGCARTLPPPPGVSCGARPQGYPVRRVLDPDLLWSSTSSRWGTRPLASGLAPPTWSSSCPRASRRRRCSSSRATSCGSAPGCRTPTCSPSVRVLPLPGLALTLPRLLRRLRREPAAVVVGLRPRRPRPDVACGGPSPRPHPLLRQPRRASCSRGSPRSVGSCGLPHLLARAVALALAAVGGIALARLGTYYVPWSLTVGLPLVVAVGAWLVVDRSAPGRGWSCCSPARSAAGSCSVLTFGGELGTRSRATLDTAYPGLRRLTGDAMATVPPVGVLPGSTT